MLAKKYVACFGKEWKKYWQEEEIYTWKEDDKESEVFAIDTPPPTISGSLHMGHIFSYCHTDFIARFQRIWGKNVFYPMGFDDNGLPTERLVEKEQKKKASSYDNKEEFMQVCRKTSEKYREKFRSLFQDIGLSVDWSKEYYTSAKYVQNIAEASFYDLLEKGRIYSKFSPSVFDVVDQTAISQAEIEENEKNSCEYDIVFLGSNGEKLSVMTTRPEMLPACVALLYNGQDARASQFREMQYVSTPFFGVNVPLIEDEQARLDKGTGLVMLCTFGDEQDVVWWNRHRDHYKFVGFNMFPKNENGKHVYTVPREQAWDWSDSDNTDIKESIHGYWKLDNKKLDEYERALENVSRYKISEIRKVMVNILRKEGFVNDERQITHTVKCAERSGTSLEMVMTLQLYVRLLDIKDSLLSGTRSLGGAIYWFPDSMQIKLMKWIEGLKSDWCITRQRYHGVKVPKVSYLTWKVDELWVYNKGGKDVINGDAKRLVDEYEKLRKDKMLMDGRVVDYGNREYFFDNVDDYEIAKEMVLRDVHYADEGIGTSSVNDGAKHMSLEALVGEEGGWCTKDNTGKVVNYCFPRYWINDAQESQIALEIFLRKYWEYNVILREEETENIKQVIQGLSNECKSDVLSKKIIDCLNDSEPYTLTKDRLISRKDRIKELCEFLPQVIPLINNIDLDDVLDTWFTSSLSPQINSGIVGDMVVSAGECNRVEMSMRPQSHEIIRTWAFYTIVKKYLHDGNYVPWKDVMISGWCLASDASKMSKSKGNVVSPDSIIREYGADVVRYWASNARVGADTVYSDKILMEGRKLITKIWSAAKFIESMKERYEIKKFDFKKVKYSVDIWIIGRCSHVMCMAQDAWKEYDYYTARDLVQKFFWNDFCDYYMEMCKTRAYGERDGCSKDGQESAIHALYGVFEAVLVMFSPIMPFVTEVLYDALYAEYKSIHLQFMWHIPLQGAEPAEGHLALAVQGELAVEILEMVRKRKSEKDLSIRAPIKYLEIKRDVDISDIKFDLMHCCNAEEILVSGGEIWDTEHMGKNTLLDSELVMCLQDE